MAAVGAAPRLNQFRRCSASPRRDLSAWRRGAPSDARERDSLPLYNCVAGPTVDPLSASGIGRDRAARVPCRPHPGLAPSAELGRPPASLAFHPSRTCSVTALATVSRTRRTPSDNIGRDGHLGDSPRVDFVENGSPPLRVLIRVGTVMGDPGVAIQHAIRRVSRQHGPQANSAKHDLQMVGRHPLPSADAAERPGGALGRSRGQGVDPECGSRRAGAAEPRWRSRPDGRAGAVRPAAVRSAGSGASGGSATDERQACYAAPGRENDEGGRFTNRGSGDSRRGFRRSAYAVLSCGLAARPPVAGRATSAVAGATPLADGSVRRSGECVFTTRPPASRGRSQPMIPAGRPPRAARYRRISGSGRSLLTRSFLWNPLR